MKRVTFAYWLLTWLAIGAWCQGVAGCAHAGKVVAGCQTEITDALVARASAALASGDYEGQLGLLLTEVALCGVREAVREAIAAAEGTKARIEPSTSRSSVIGHNGEAWLLAHPL